MFSQDWDWSWGWWLDFSKVLLIGYLITAHVTDTRRLRIVFLVLALSLGFEAAKQGWVNLIRHPGAANMNSHPVLGDNNGVAVGLLMLVPVLGALARSANSLGERWLHRFIALGVLMRGISTYSRGGFLAAGALGLAYVAQSKRRITTLVVTAVLATTVLSVMPASFWDRMRTITASDEERDSSAQSRLYFWQVAVRMMMDHPFTGIGFNAYTRMYDAYDTSDRVYGRLRAVHSSWFGALSEMGVPGLLLVLALLANAVQNCRRVRQRPAHEGQYKTRSEFATGLLTSFFVFAVGGSFINAHYNELFWHLVCLATAVRYAEPAEVQAPSPVVGGVVGQHAVLST
jgi:probable O-glycosylation ligase (exosortase A-associated)